MDQQNPKNEVHHKSTPVSSNDMITNNHRQLVGLMAGLYLKNKMSLFLSFIILIKRILIPAANHQINSISSNQH